MYMLGTLYTTGQGVPIDYGMAVVWFDKAVHSNDPQILEQAIKARDELRFLLEQVASSLENVELAL